MVNIRPINVPIKGTATKMNVLVLNFATNATTCTTYWQLFTSDDSLVIDGNYELTPEQFATWGQDNNYVNQCVANAINVTIIP